MCVLEGIMCHRNSREQDKGDEFGKGGKVELKKERQVSPHREEYIVLTAHFFQDYIHSFRHNFLNF